MSCLGLHDPYKTVYMKQVKLVVKNIVDMWNVLGIVFQLHGVCTAFFRFAALWQNMSTHVFKSFVCHRTVTWLIAPLSDTAWCIILSANKQTKPHRFNMDSVET